MAADCLTRDRNRSHHLLDPLSTGAVLYQRGDFKFIAGSPREETLWLLGAEGLRKFEELRSQEPSGSIGRSEGQRALPDGGPRNWAATRDRCWSPGAGNAGHGHADALSIHLVGGGETLLMDPGTLEYVGETYADRNFFRGTAAHNTLRVDERDQAQGVPPFAWWDLPKVKADRWVVGERFDLLSGPMMATGGCLRQSNTRDGSFIANNNSGWFAISQPGTGHTSWRCLGALARGFPRLPPRITCLEPEARRLWG